MAILSSGGVPVDFKGAMVLHAFLYENGISETAVRPTRDIDANWFSVTPPSMDEIVSAFQLLFSLFFFNDRQSYTADASYQHMMAARPPG